jgi:lactoylglutathione lyase
MKKIAFLITIVALSTSLHAQDSTAFDFTFNHMALSVTNLDSSLLFYEKVFQLKEITNRSKIEGIRWLSLTEGKELHLISIIKEKITANKALHLAFTTQNFDAFVSRLDTMHIAYSDWPGTPHAITKRADGVKQVYFQDPDGYWIEVNNGYAAVK